MKYFFILCFLYLLTTMIYAKEYHGKFLALHESFMRALERDDLSQMACWVDAERKHQDGYKDIETFWLPSWIRADHKSFGENCR